MLDDETVMLVKVMMDARMGALEDLALKLATQHERLLDVLARMQRRQAAIERALSCLGSMLDHPAGEQGN